MWKNNLTNSPGIVDHYKEAGFKTGRGVTVKISEGCIVLMADCNEVQELREQLYQAKQVVRGIKDVLVKWAERRLNNKKAGKS
ncbi:hypothetical protein [Mangrovibacter phragmitis]|uniref:hypothetical protein n=1 Tax=Mangrovibacter phragmitis TaxID=1691903 RepID=UPI003512A904